jgi:glycosyltransferase involved in cell wall biosynthesis
MKIVHCITGLTPDGAQRMLLRVARSLNTMGFENRVISLGSPHPFGEEFEKNGIPVSFLGLRSNVRGIAGIRTLRALLREESPHILQGWMYHGNLLLSLARPTLATGSPVVWNIRRGMDDYRERKMMTRWVVKASAQLSKTPEKIVYCTEESRRQHEEFGFDSRKGIVIGNGFDAQRFRPRPEARRQIREKLGFTDETVVIGNVGRYDVAKGRTFLIDAFAMIHRLYPHARLMLVGRGLNDENLALKNRLQELGISKNVVLYGESSAIEEVYPAFDVMCSSSVAEGFPNVVAEAMLSELPCVATNTGNTRKLLEGVGFVVPSRDPQLLSEALGDMCARSPEARSAMGRLSRERIARMYSLETVAAQYAQLYRSLAGFRKSGGKCALEEAAP